jgi:hypothetical protein
MTDHKIFGKVLDKFCPRTGADNVYINAINCQRCRSEVIVEYNVEADLINLYNFDIYYLNNQRIVHVHPADERTKNIVLEMIAAEKRLLHVVDPGDYCYRRE